VIFEKSKKNLLSGITPGEKKMKKVFENHISGMQLFLSGVFAFLVLTEQAKVRFSLAQT